jgi:hypothetical protein
MLHWLFVLLFIMLLSRRVVPGPRFHGSRLPRFVLLPVKIATLIHLKLHLTRTWAIEGERGLGREESIPGGGGHGNGP